MYRVILGVLICFSCGVVMSGMVGGPTKQDPSKPEHMERAWKAVKGVNDEASNNGPYHFIPIKVLKADSQVVAGVKYIYEIAYGESDCKRGDFQAHELTSANCNLKNDGRRAIYKVELWEKPWENFEQFNVEKIRDVGADESI